MVSISIVIRTRAFAFAQQQCTWKHGAETMAPNLAGAEVLALRPSCNFGVMQLGTLQHLTVLRSLQLP